MTRLTACFVAATLLLLSACSSEAEPEKTLTPVNIETDETIEQEAKSINDAADEAAALVEAEANAEVKAANEQVATDDFENESGEGSDK
jgi:hypothetical protein